MPEPIQGLGKYGFPSGQSLININSPRSGEMAAIAAMTEWFQTLGNLWDEQCGVFNVEQTPAELCSSFHQAGAPSQLLHSPALRVLVKYFVNTADWW